MSLKKAIPLGALIIFSLSALTKADSPIEVQDAAPAVDETINKMAVASPKNPWKPTSVHVPDGSLAEQFSSKEDFQKHWVPSRSKKEDIPGNSDDKDQELWQYRGKWVVEEASQLVGSGPGDLGLVMQDPAAHYAISRRLSKPVQFKGRDTVTIQYEVKFQNGLECGGAYMKLLSVDPNFDPAKFSDKSPYTIMFGPDKCGSTNKVHFIFRHKNLKTGKIIEHHHKNPPSVPSTYSKETHLYTLLIHPELNTFEIKVDNDSKSKGSLLADFEPPIVPPKEIDDVNDKKPSDWVDQPKMKDPNAIKPDDWDESAPAEIEDMAATQPEDWLENEPEYVPDPDAKKPADWDEEEDGSWTAPTIVNPKCIEGPGCGKWKRPMIKNPEYKGKWNAPMIDNPAYKGAWKPKKVPNPEYVEDKHPGYMTPIGALGLELWTMQEKILFDNILVSDSMTAEQLEAWTKDTWVDKHNFELEINKAEQKDILKAQEAPKGSIIEELKAQFSIDGIKKFFDMLTTDPKNISKQFPMVIGALGAVFAIVFTLVITFMFGTSKAQEKTKRNDKKQDLSDGDDQDDEKDGDSAIKSSPLKKGALRKRAAKKDMAGEDQDTDETSSNENKADDDAE